MLLQIADVSLTLRSSDGRCLPVLEQVSLDLDCGQCLGVAGESGSGKSVLALGLMGLLPRSSIAALEGTMIFQGRDLMRLAEAERRSLRGQALAMVFQEPMSAMNPLLTLEEQVGETVAAHVAGVSSSEIRRRVVQALKRSGFAEPERFLASYPHQLSGGMRQRAMLAMALVLEPQLIIADEPTTALDAALQVQLLKELRALVREQRHAMMFISHDLGVIRSIADRLAVMYAGVIVELGDVATVLERPAHPYTSALIRSMPRLVQERRLPQPIPGHLPHPDRKPAGCVFSDRCPRAQDLCRRERPSVSTLAGGQQVRCRFPEHD
ncbi:MAG TPA: ABC transporter ATP-binding protein [Candidatus Ozemobacteraceae bacterium]|nr:ABC transporter ATP-binding protein [Candidatus Ozemobacteraceae bacterium]